MAVNQTNLKHIKDDKEFYTELATAGSKLVVVNFYEKTTQNNWCDSCRNLAPKYADLAGRYPEVVFLNVANEECQELTVREGIDTKIHNIIFYINKRKVYSMHRIYLPYIEAKVNEHNPEDSRKYSALPVKGHINLVDRISHRQSECLNESTDHPYKLCLTSEGGFLESDGDQQLIVHLKFFEPLKIHCLKLHCSQANGPKTVKVFINQPQLLDFDSALSMKPIQLLQLTPENLTEEACIPLNFVKFQSVGSLTMFVQANQNGAETTRIDNLSIFGPAEWNPEFSYHVGFNETHVPHGPLPPGMVV